MKTFLIMTLTFVSSTVLAQDCWKLYQAKEAKIEKNQAHTEQVGNGFIFFNGQAYYNPGLTVAGETDNWAKDFLNSITMSPSVLSIVDDEGIQSWHKAFYSAIEDKCHLPKDDVSSLQKILKSLMDDGSFCPEGKILHPHFIMGKKPFKEILQQAVASKRFQEDCAGADGHIGSRANSKKESKSETQTQEMKTIIEN